MELRIFNLSFSLVLSFCTLLSQGAQQQPQTVSGGTRKQINSSERRKLIKQVRETLRDPQDKELDKITVDETPAPPAVPAQQPAPVLLSIPKRQVASVTKSGNNTLILNWFSVGIGNLSDSDGGSAFASLVNWTPTYIFDSNFRMMGQLGFLAGNLFSRGTFKGLDTSLSTVFSGVNNLLFEIGAGFQYWDGRGGWLPQIRGSIGYRMPLGEKYIRALNMSYARLFNDQIAIHVTAVSLSFRF